MPVMIKEVDALIADFDAMKATAPYGWMDRALVVLRALKDESLSVVCIYCGHKERVEDRGEAMLAHISQCDKRPEKKLLEIIEELCSSVRH